MNTENEPLCPGCGRRNRRQSRFCCSCGSPLTEKKREIIPASSGKAGLSPVEAGKKPIKDRYAVTGSLHKDREGEVYLCRDVYNDRTLVLKEDGLKDGLISDEEKNSFLKAGEVLSGIRHKNIVRIIDYFVLDNKYYTVFPYMAEYDLENLIVKKKIKADFSLIARCGMNLAEILEFCHKRNPPVYHLNLKPSKILLTKDEKVRLLPWIPHRSQGALIGTSGFASPEQFRGEGDACSDIYGLCATLHYLLTAQDPRREAPFLFLPLSVFRPQLGKNLENILRKGLELKPEHRFSNMKEFRENFFHGVKGLI